MIKARFRNFLNWFHILVTHRLNLVDFVGRVVTWKSNGHVFVGFRCSTCGYIDKDQAYIIGEDVFGNDAFNDDITTPEGNKNNE